MPDFESVLETQGDLALRYTRLTPLGEGDKVNNHLLVLLSLNDRAALTLSIGSNGPHQMDMRKNASHILRLQGMAMASNIKANSVKNSRPPLLEDINNSCPILRRESAPPAATILDF